MGYFPFFVDLTNRPGLIVGGGAVALRKVEKLLPYDPRLTVCGLTFLPELERLPGLKLVRGPFTPELLRGMSFVIAATGDHVLNHRISALCRRRGILINAVDDRDACSFLFPALVRRGDLSIGICTAGASPSFAAFLRIRIDAMLPEQTAPLLESLAALRETVQSVLPDESSRAAFFDQVITKSLAARRALSSSETDALLRQAAGEKEDVS